MAQILKLLLVGDAESGKSCLLYRYVDDTFSPTYISTIGVDFKIRIVREHVKLQIWDTAGQERFRTITASYYRGAHGILIAYDASKPDGHRNLQHWIDEVNKFGAPGVARLVVGCKVDAAAGLTHLPQQHAEVKALCEVNGIKMAGTGIMGHPLFDGCSAKTNSHVTEVFEELACEASDFEAVMHSAPGAFDDDVDNDDGDAGHRPVRHNKKPKKEKTKNWWGFTKKPKKESAEYTTFSS